jgi:ribose 5-phosphate isomerase B
VIQVRIHIGCDPIGERLTERLRAVLAEAGHDVVDHGPGHGAEAGPRSGEPAQGDELAIAITVGQAVAAEPGSLGIIVGTHGNGSQVGANKVVGIRAALAWNERSAVLARERLDANVLAVGACLLDEDTLVRAVVRFAETPFGGRPFDRRRIEEITDYEADR